MMDPAERHEIREGSPTHRISGALLMALATLLVTGMVICVRMVPGRLHPFQLALWGTLIFLSSTCLALKESGSSEVSVP